MVHVLHNRYIAKLPDEWDEGGSDEPESAAYARNLARIRDLSARRARLRSKVASHKSVIAIITPFTDPWNNIQPHLVTRDGPLVAELTRCRSLAVRVGGRLADWEGKGLLEDGVKAMVDEDEGSGGQSAVSVASSSEEKLRKALDWG